MKKTIIAMSFLLAVSVTLVSCKKDKIASKRINGDTYMITSLSVDGTSMSSTSTLKFDDCDIYDESCTGMLTNADGSTAAFYWQFRDKGKTFEIQNSSQSGNMATGEAISISGVYNVDENEDDMLKLTGSSAQGKSVAITMQEQ